jgi:hypothetical protein
VNQRRDENGARDGAATKVWSRAASHQKWVGGGNGATSKTSLDGVEKIMVGMADARTMDREDSTRRLNIGFF